MTCRTLVVGVGNLLLGDEGLGVHVARSLDRRRGELAPGTEVLEAGTSLLDHLPELAGYPAAIVIDAIRLGGTPGTVYRLDDLLRALPDRLDQRVLSLHDLDLLAVLGLGRRLGLLPGRLSLLGAEPKSLEPRTSLSPALESACERIVEELLGALGTALGTGERAELSGLRPAASPRR